MFVKIVKKSVREDGQCIVLVKIDNALCLRRWSNELFVKTVKSMVPEVATGRVVFAETNERVVFATRVKRVLE